MKNPVRSSVYQQMFSSWVRKQLKTTVACIRTQYRVQWYNSVVVLNEHSVSRTILNFLNTCRLKMAVFWNVPLWSLIQIDDVSAGVVTASIRMMCQRPDDGGSKHVWNVVNFCKYGATSQKTVIFVLLAVRTWISPKCWLPREGKPQNTLTAAVGRESCARPSNVCAEFACGSPDTSLGGWGSHSAAVLTSPLWGIQRS
jgi:hypothetical protein